MGVNLYEMIDTWNDAAVTFTAIKMNVTDTASAAASNLLDLQVGGVSRFEVSKAGKLTIDRGAFQNGGVTFFGNPANFYSRSVGVLNFAQSNTLAVDIAYPNFTLSSDYTLAWASTSGTVGASGSKDLFIRRDAANTLAQRNATNAQTFRLYNTFTDASNFERGFMRWSSNTLEIGTEAGGTGTNRKVTLKGGNTIQLQLETDITYTRSYLGFGSTAGTATASLRSDVAGVLRLANGISTTNGAAHELIEMTAPAAPDADRVRIYAEDDGAGKTRLMARFATGSAVQIAIEP
jgi:hypothetical protein